jgi:serine/threonine protein kinase
MMSRPDRDNMSMRSVNSAVTESPRSPIASPERISSPISSPKANKKKNDDSTPLLIGEIDKYALNRIRNAGDFTVNAVVGKGNFGVVFLAQEKNSTRTLAVKRMNKNMLIDRNQVLTILTEALVMKEATAGDSPWLTQLHYAWNDSFYLYLAMDFCCGGDLRCVLENVELDEPSVRFFAAEMIQAVHALHQRGYVHRDLKV